VLMLLLLHSSHRLFTMTFTSTFSLLLTSLLLTMVGGQRVSQSLPSASKLLSRIGKKFASVKS
jgi:hypothetical protein